jgi:hypothetical protein
MNATSRSGYLVFLCVSFGHYNACHFEHYNACHFERSRERHFRWSSTGCCRVSTALDMTTSTLDRTTGTPLDLAMGI